MSERKFMIGSGYYDGPNSGSDWFYRIWEKNTVQSFNNYSCVFVLCVDSFKRFPQSYSSHVELIRLTGNLGHVGQLLSGEKSHRICGWSAAVITLAMLAYTAECDFIYKEQDCLAFGPWIDKLYEELGDAGMIFGSCKLMPAAQSLFLVKHEYIPIFVKRYLSGEPENTTAWLPEKKFERMERECQQQAVPKVKRFSFPFDRDRPLDFSLPVWYGQKFTKAELLAMRSLGLIEFDEIPDVKCFTNDTTNVEL